MCIRSYEDLYEIITWHDSCVCARVCVSIHVRENGLSVFVFIGMSIYVCVKVYAYYVHAYSSSTCGWSVYC